MKLKDIFNIDLSTRGGAKLYRKIMGKYNIPKSDSKQLVKEIRNSSTDNTKYGYYKFTKAWMEVINNFDSVLPMIEMLLNFSRYIEIHGICGGHYQTLNSVYLDHSSLLYLILQGKDKWPYFESTVFNLGIKVNEEPLKLSLLNSREADKEFDIDVCIEGGLKDRMIAIGQSAEEFDTLFETITEEEYEHLLDNIN